MIARIQPDMDEDHEGVRTPFLCGSSIFRNASDLPGVINREQLDVKNDYEFSNLDKSVLPRKKDLLENKLSLLFAG